MSDASSEVTVSTPAPASQNRRKTTLNDTASISMSTAGVGGLIIWVFQCINAKQLLPPDDTTAMLMGGFVLPIFHAGRDALVKWIDARAA